MQLTTRLPKRRTPRPTESATLTSEAAETRDAPRGGGPEAQALYSCMCYAFMAAVTTSVDCPHCGIEQAW